MRIVLCYPLEKRHYDQIVATAPDAEVVDAGQERVAQELFTADLFCGHAKVPVDWDGVVRQGRLRWIQSSAAGTDHFLVPSVIASEILVTSASGVLADQVAEQAVALLTGLLRQLPVFFRQQQIREYERRPTRDLTGLTVGIVGFGGIGRRLAEVLSPFKTRIIATDLFPVDKPPHVEALWPAEKLDDLLQAADVVLLAVPLTAQTRGMINRHTLELMKPGAVLVNVARGKLIIEDDLVAALRSRRFWGAAIDVAFEEPLPQDSALWDAPDLIITPHVGGQSERRAEQITNFFCENLRRYLAGETLLNLVDKRLGFPIRRANS